MWLGPTQVVRERARQLFEPLQQELSPFSMENLMKSWLAVPLPWWTGLTLKCWGLQHPRLVRTEYRVE